MSVDLILDPEYCKKNAKGHKLKVDLKKTYKGTSLVAKTDIKKGNIAAYYKFRVYNPKSFSAQKDGMYTMTVYNKNGNSNNYFSGDIYKGSLEKPRGDIPFWAYFSNEPSEDQGENVYIDENLKENYKNRDSLKNLDTMVYKLVAFKNIKKGEEICWCYGDFYIRNYKSRC